MTRVYEVTVLPEAMADDYAMAWERLGLPCPPGAWEKVRGWVAKHCPGNRCYLVERPCGTSYLSAPATGWLHWAPEAGTYHVLKEVVE